MSEAVISGTGLFTPKASISNAELVASFNAYVEDFNATHAEQIASGECAALEPSSVAFIEKASGIKSRYVIDKQGILDPQRMCPHIAQPANDEPGILCQIAVQAAKQALSQANKTPQDVDAVIVACSNLERAYPAVAVEVQHYLGIDGFAYDMNVACSSATFGMHAAESMIRAGTAKSVLMLNPEVTTAHLNFRDRDSHFIFGDACTAVLLEHKDSCTVQRYFEIVDIRAKTVFSNNIRNNFGFLNRCDESGVGCKDKLFIQQGRKVFKEVSPMVAALIVQHLEDKELSPADLSRLWLHQANINMNQLIAKKVLGREAMNREAPVILDEYANTSSAGSIIAFHKYNADLDPGDLGIICSFGAGYSVGNVIVKLHNTCT